jgi:hypothetical protein
MRTYKKTLLTVGLAVGLICGANVLMAAGVGGGAQKAAQSQAKAKIDFISKSQVKKVINPNSKAARWDKAIDHGKT